MSKLNLFKKMKRGIIMSIKAGVRVFYKDFNADVEFSQTAISFYGPAWEIGFFFGLLPIRGKTKEILRIEYSDIEEVVVGKSAIAFSKKEACFIKTKGSSTEKAKKVPPIEVRFTPFEAGRAMLFEHVGERFVTDGGLEK